MKKIISVVSTILATVSSAFAQMPSTLYFMDQNPLIHNFNPDSLRRVGVCHFQGGDPGSMNRMHRVESRYARKIMEFLLLSRISPGYRVGFLRGFGYIGKLHPKPIVFSVLLCYHRFQNQERRWPCAENRHL